MTTTEFLILGKFDGEGGAIIFNNDFHDALSKISKVKKVNYDEEFKYSGEMIIVLFDFGYFNNAGLWMKLMLSLPKERTWVYFHRVFRNRLFKSFSSVVQNFLSPHSEASQVILQNVQNANILELPHGVRKFKAKNSKRTVDLLSIGYAGQYKKISFIENCFKNLKSYSSHVVVGSRLKTRNKTEETLEQVKVSKGYYANDEIDNFLTDSKIAVFSYEHLGEDTPIGASGIARLAAVQGCLVMINSHPMFSDLEEHFLVYNSDFELEEIIEKYLTDAELFQAQIKKQEQWVEKNQWESGVGRLAETMSKL